MDVVVLALAKKYTDTSIEGTTGPLHGKSAYEIAVSHGYVGSETEWLDSLQGESPEIEVKTDTPEEYILTISTADGSFDTPNLKGSTIVVQTLGQSISAVISQKGVTDTFNSLAVTAEII